MLTFSISNQSTQQVLTPFIDIYEQKDKVIVFADMPGVSRGGLDIRVEGDRLTIQGQCQREKTNQTPSVERARLVSECPRCNYYRTLKLSSAIDTEGIQAEMNDGVLTLTFPKKQSDPMITIPISVED